MKISIVQNKIEWGFREKNLTSFEKFAKECYGKTDLLVLPEMFSTGFAVNSPELSESIDGEAITAVKTWAKEGNFAVVGSIMAKEKQGENYKYFNRSFFCQPDGKIDFADKRHLFIGDEQKFFTAGNKILTVEYLGVKFRLLVCYDLRFPVWSRFTDENPYDVLIYCANWPRDRIDAWDTLLLARAVENQAFVCAANAVGKDSYNVHHNGHSCIIAPRGEKLLSFEDDEIGVKTIEIDLNYQKKIREKFPFLKNGDKFEIVQKHADDTD
ncbi:MAG: nitrilase family protein [Prevotellaceae bacterium]|jgi:predicted amidohydrolase|nr:nitrilase family protein [Prevotellaceae bacterium]